MEARLAVPVVEQEPESRGGFWGHTTRARRLEARLVAHLDSHTIPKSFELREVTAKQEVTDEKIRSVRVKVRNCVLERESLDCSSDSYCSLYCKVLILLKSPLNGEVTFDDMLT